MAEGTILDQLIRVERAELEKYCESVEISGVIAQTASFVLRRGQSMWVTRGGLLAYSDAIDWTMRIPGGAEKALGRLLTGEGISLTHVQCKGDRGSVVVSANQPGRLATWDLSHGPIICTPGSFVAALGNVQIDVTTARSAGAAFFGGAGLFLQRLSGTGVVVVHGAGDFIERQLAAGETLLVSTGNLAVFSDAVSYDIRGVGGCWKMMVGGEGIFMVELKGPGWVMLQSMKKRSAARRAQQQT